MFAVYYPVHTFRLVAGCEAIGGVFPIPTMGPLVKPVDLIATDHHRVAGRGCLGIGTVVSTARWRFGKVVVISGLIIDDRNGACRTG